MSFEKKIHDNIDAVDYKVENLRGDNIRANLRSSEDYKIDDRISDVEKDCNEYTDEKNGTNINIDDTEDSVSIKNYIEEHNPTYRYTSIGKEICRNPVDVKPESDLDGIYRISPLGMDQWDHLEPPPPEPMRKVGAPYQTPREYLCHKYIQADRYVAMCQRIGIGHLGSYNFPTVYLSISTDVPANVFISIGVNTWVPDEWSSPFYVKFNVSIEATTSFNYYNREYINYFRNVTFPTHTDEKIEALIWAYSYTLMPDIPLRSYKYVSFNDLYTYLHGMNSNITQDDAFSLAIFFLEHIWIKSKFIYIDENPK
jgi:hypothetical protein